MITRIELEKYCAGYLQTATFKDYCPNGLQVQGRSEIKKIVSGVTASEALIDRAIEAGADAILVHHGYFWKNEPQVITGMKQRRVKKLLANDISLFAYHLPLDLHEEVGNNIQLAKKLGYANATKHENSIVFYADISSTHLAVVASNIEKELNRKPLVIGELDSEVKRVAWCTGGAQSYIDMAIDLGADVYISGEVSENTFHTAIESGIAYIAAGHHATERYGVQALGRHLVDKYSVEHEFVDIDNPV